MTQEESGCCMSAHCAYNDYYNDYRCYYSDLVYHNCGATYREYYFYTDEYYCYDENSCPVLSDCESEDGLSDTAVLWIIIGTMFFAFCCIACFVKSLRKRNRRS